MHTGGPPRKARVYDRLEGQEVLPQAPQRWAQVDAAAAALRPGSIVSLAYECDELLVARRASDSGAWSLSVVSMDWSSRGTSGWHTHALDYAVESLEPHCLFRVLRDGPRIALASLSADGHLLCATASGDRLALAACGSSGGGSAWVAAGASWEQRDGALRNSRWTEKILAARLLHITCLPTLQLQRCEEYYGGLLHELHSEKAGLQKRLQELEEQRDAALLEARHWQHTAEEQEAMLVQVQHREQHLPAANGAAALEVEGHAPQGDAIRQLAALHEQLESLAEGGLPALQQERARMSICLQTIKEITDMVRQSTSGAPSSASSEGLPEVVVAATAAAASAAGAGCLPQLGAPPYVTDTEGESRLRDYLGARPEQQDPLERLGLEAAPPPPRAEPSGASDEPESTPQRVLRALENAPPSSRDPDSAPPSILKAAAPQAQRCARSSAQRPLSESLTAAVHQLETGSPHQANGVAQYLATSVTSLGGLPAALRASQQRQMAAVGRAGKGAGSRAAASAGGNRLRSSFLQRPLLSAEDLLYC